MGAAHAHHRAQLRALGLHLFATSRPLRAHRDRVLPERGQVADDGAVPEDVFGTADPDLPSPRRVRDGRHGRADSDQQRSGSERSRDGESARRQVARSHAPDTTAPGSRIPASCRSRARFSMRTCRRRTSCTCCATTSSPTRETLLAPQRRHDHARRLRRQHRSLPALSRRVARRPRLRADPSPDGRRRDRRDLAHAALAMAARAASSRSTTARRSISRCSTRRSRPCASASPRRRCPARRASKQPPTCSASSRMRASSPISSRSPRIRELP